MKKILLLSLSLFAICQASAQWLGTNPVYFNAGNVGIGTSTPSHRLDIVTTTDYQGIQLYHSGGRWSRFYSSMPAGSFNGITAQNDAGIIFGLDGGTLTHGFVIAPHRFLTSGLRIDNAGNVGVGASSPDGFQVGVSLSQETSRGIDNVRLGIMGTPRIILDKAGQVPFEIDNAGGRLRIFNPGVELFTINSSGNVGIGTNTPNLKLHLATSNTLDGLGLHHSNGAWANFYSPSMTGGAFNGITQAGDAGVIFGNNGGLNTVSNGFVIAPHRSTTSGLRINNNGNVGIGTSNPTQKLTVNGTIYGKEVKVDLNVPGPDYVFSNNYQLLTLNELKTYIDQNKHLPEVPSAAAMEASGINLGEMNMLLLRKIEELTLYIIDQRKELDELKQRSVSPDPSGKKIEELTLYVIELKEEVNKLKNNKSNK